MHSEEAQAWAKRSRNADPASNAVRRRDLRRDQDWAPRAVADKIKNMRRGVEQHLTLDQGLAHQAEFVIFEIAQAAMNELSGA